MEKEIPKDYFKDVLNEYKGQTLNIFTSVVHSAEAGTECVTAEIVHVGSDYVHVVEYGEDDKKGINDHSFIPYNSIARVTVELEDGRKPQLGEAR